MNKADYILHFNKDINLTSLRPYILNIQFQTDNEELNQRFINVFSRKVIVFEKSLFYRIFKGKDFLIWFKGERMPIGTNEKYINFDELFIKSIVSVAFNHIDDLHQATPYIQQFLQETIENEYQKYKSLVSIKNEFEFSG